MSSTIPYTPTSPGEPLDELESAGIPHFDATLRRKERMRQAAANRQPAPPAASNAAPNTVSNTNGHAAHSPTPAPAPAPAVEVPAPASPAPAPAATSSAAARLSGPELERFLIDFVVEQTGYPSEMVELDADLEADLGIDSIKKAQLFGELANDFDVKPSDDFSLDDFPTLRHVLTLLESLPETSSAAQAPTETSVAASHAGLNGAASSPASVPAASAPAPAPAAPASTGPALSGVALEEFLVNFVVEQTGYPPEMVELDADLEADLGIDSIKKAQLFGELANEFDVQASDDLSLDDFPTLRDVKDFLEQSSPAPASAPAATSAGDAPAAPAPAPQSAPQSNSAGSALSGAALEEFLVNFVVEQTGYPPEMVELDADLEADLGIDSIKKAQLFGELANDFDVQASDELSLDDFPTLRHVKTFLESAQHAAP